MSVNGISKVELDGLMEWFVEHRQAVLDVARIARSSAAILEAGITTGQANRPETTVGYAFKYELENGLLGYFERFADGCLSKDRYVAAGLADLASLVAEVVSYIDEHRKSISRARYDDRREAAEALTKLRDLTSRLDDLVDVCTAQLVERYTEMEAQSATPPAVGAEWPVGRRRGLSSWRRRIGRE